MAKKTKEEMLVHHQQQQAKSAERIRALQKSIKDTNRKKDTRRKIILGAGLLERAAKDDSSSRFIEYIIRKLDRPTDIAAFADFEIPRPKPEDSEAT